MTEIQQSAEKSDVVVVKAKKPTVVTMEVTAAESPKTPETVEEAIELYNEMAQTLIDLGDTKAVTVKTFANLKTGVLACQRRHAAILRAKEPKKVEEEKIVTTKTEKKTSAKKAPAKKAAAAKKAPAKKVPAKKAATKKAATRTARVSALKLTDETKFLWVGPNPFREGSGKHARTAKVQESTERAQTWAALRAKKIKSGTLRVLHRMGVVKAA